MKKYKSVFAMAAIGVSLLVGSPALSANYDCSVDNFYEVCKIKPPSDYSYWVRIAQCESPGSGKWGVNWKYRDKVREGAFRIRSGTWDTWRLHGYPHSANRASWYQQINVAARIAYYNAGWPDKC